MNDALIVTVLSMVPKGRVARWMGGVARTRFPRAVQRLFLRWYVGKYGVDLDDCVGELGDYDSLAAFFTRALKPGVRPVDSEPTAIVSPVDGRVYTVGVVKAGRIPQAEGQDFSVAELLGEPDRYEGGAFAILYLSPRDYHRVHTPREGAVARWRYTPGRLWPVFPAATRHVPDLFARNERLTTFLAADIGEIALVMVGAFGVGRMQVVYADVMTNAGRPGGENLVTPPHLLGRAAELGRFEMGSTVILLFPPGRATLSLEAGAVVRLGARIGQVAG